MSKLYNNLEIHIENLEDSHIQKYEPNTPYSFKETGHYYLFYVRHGKLQIISDRKEFQIGIQQLLIVKCIDIVHLSASFYQADVLVFHFSERTGNISLIVDTIFDAEDDIVSLLSSIEYRLNIIRTIKTSKPSILYDKEIGNYFNVNSSLLYSFFNSFLLLLIEHKVLTTLPDDILYNYITKATHGTSQHKRSTQHHPKVPQKHLYKNELVNQIITYMSNNLSRNLTIDGIAEEFLVGAANLKRIFKNETGQSIIHYFHILKMDAAQALIIKNEKSYTEIASLLGFNSVHHFSTAFKKHTGYSPSKFYQTRMMR